MLLISYKISFSLNFQYCFDLHKSGDTLIVNENLNYKGSIVTLYILGSLGQNSFIVQLPVIPLFRHPRQMKEAPEFFYIAAST